MYVSGEWLFMDCTAPKDNELLSVMLALGNIFDKFVLLFIPESEAHVGRTDGRIDYNA